MLNEFVSNVATVIKDKDIQSLAVEGAENLFVGIATKDITSFSTVAKDIRETVLSIPNVIFADKMYRFLTKAFSDYEQQVMFASKFEKDAPKYNDTVKKIVQIIDKIDFDEKVDVFANLTRAVCLDLIDVEAYLKLSTSVSTILYDDLIFLKELYNREEKYENSTLSTLYSYGLANKYTPNTCGSISSCYKISDDGKEMLRCGIDLDNYNLYK